MTQYLAHAVLHQGHIHRNSIVRIENGSVIITPFDGEVQSTVFIPGIIAVCAADRVDDSSRRSMQYKVQSAPLVESAIRRLSEYLKSSELYAYSSDRPILIMLPRK
ncbi:MAG: hypothetical protein NC127_06545 [Muribaculum sp.]|nr:hypothetical protein [Muribaculum sp.]